MNHKIILIVFFSFMQTPSRSTAPLMQSSYMGSPKSSIPDKMSQSVHGKLESAPVQIKRREKPSTVDNSSSAPVSQSKQDLNNSAVVTGVETIASTTTTTTTTTINTALTPEAEIVTVTENVVETSANGETVETNKTVEIKTESAEVRTKVTPEMVEISRSTDQLAVNNMNEEQRPLDNNDMTASMIQKRVTTAEEAKAALAERRRLAREEAERQAEIERQRIEAEEVAEQQRQAEEEEKQRRLEEETLHLVAEQRKAEEQRLLEAIEVCINQICKLIFKNNEN